MSEKVQLLWNRYIWNTAELPPWSRPVFLHSLLEGSVSLRIFWSGRFSDSLEQKQCDKSRWRQIMRELASVTGVIGYQLSRNWSLPPSWGKSWSIINSKGERMSPCRAALLKPKWNSICFSLADYSQHLSRRTRIILRMATLLFPALLKCIKGQSREEGVDFLSALRKCVVTAQQL